MLKGKRLSVLGDSVSTYNGVSNDAQANNTILSNPSYYCKRHFPVESAYWHIVLDKYGMSLCVNNSWSGGNLSGRDNICSGVNRALQLARDSGEAPDFIIVFMGLNDLGRGIDKTVFALDYELTLLRIREKYPEACVCCVNMPDRYGQFAERTKEINNAIENAVSKMGEGFFIARLYDYKFKDFDDYYYMTFDGLHPNFKGMEIIADVICRAIDENT